MATANGQFVWYELMTTDQAAARDFYSKVVGWKAMDAQMPGMDYWMFAAGERPVAGLMDLPPEARTRGVPPNWIGYVEVDDVDGIVAKVTANGGAVHHPPTDIPNVGRFAVVADPQGAVFALIQEANPTDFQPLKPDQPGYVGWNELYAVDHASVLDFYGKLFGWVKKDSMDMGPMGQYVLFGASTGDAYGGMMDKPAEIPVANWHYYFRVGNIDEAEGRVKAAGGQVMFGPQEVPGGDYILMAMDPQGAAFALVGKR